MAKDKNPKVNAAMALCCGVVLHSKHRHDFVTCKCKKLSIDGGNDYIKIVGEEAFYHRIWTLQELTEMRELEKILQDLQGS